MDKLARFTDYDVFAYIASGLAALVVWDIVFSTHYVLSSNWTASTGALTIAAAYIVGQILAAPSGWLVERQFVHHILYRPSVVLLSGKRLGWRKILKNTLLQDYYTPLASSVLVKVRERAVAELGVEVTGETIFWCAFPAAKKDHSAYARMDGFLKLYGFCRNIAFVSLAGACFIAIDAVLEWSCKGPTDHVVQQLNWASIALLVGLGMLHRYLKFFRLYNVEVFVSYSEGSSTSRTPT